MNGMLNTFLQLDGGLFVLIGLVVLAIPSPQPGLTKKVNPEDLLPFSQTRRLLASMFIASGLLVLVVGRYGIDPEMLHAIARVRIASFALVIVLNLLQLQSKRWKAAPLLLLVSIFSLMSGVYLYLLMR